MPKCKECGGRKHIYMDDAMQFSKPCHICNGTGQEPNTDLREKVAEIICKDCACHSEQGCSIIADGESGKDCRAANETADRIPALFPEAKYPCCDTANKQGQDCPIHAKEWPKKLGGHQDEDKRYYAGGYDQALDDCLSVHQSIVVEKDRGIELLSLSLNHMTKQYEKLEEELQAHKDATLDGDCEVCDYQSFTKQIRVITDKLNEYIVKNKELDGENESLRLQNMDGVKRVKELEEEVKKANECDYCGSTDLVCGKAWKEEREKLKGERDCYKKALQAIRDKIRLSIDCKCVEVEAIATQALEETRNDPIW